MKRTMVLAVTLALVLMVPGCSTYLKKRQLQKVAKDWSLVVRASQVIPVYPLTEDLQPGDVFLVQTPASEEVKTYTKRGFLPLEQHLVRLPVANYDEFYRERNIRGNRIRVFQPFAGADPVLSITNAPRAAFPSYSFSVSSGGGFNLALPIQGVPVALGLLGADRAQGNIALSDASTYGIDIASLIGELESWAADNVSRLAPYASSLELATDRETSYLRVVTRVYLIGGVNVTLSHAGSFGTRGGAGSDKEVDVPLASTNALDGYTNMLAKLNASTTDALAPGGSFKFASATARSVSMDEDFARPLVIGYLAFDVPIYRSEQEDIAKGVPPIVLGAPSPTWSKLNEKKVHRQVHEVHFKSIRGPEFVAAQDRVEELLLELNGLADSAVLKIANNLPVEPGDELQKVMGLRFPNNVHTRNPSAAREFLKTLIVQGERSPAALAAWAAAFKESQ